MYSPTWRGRSLGWLINSICNQLNTGGFQILTLAHINVPRIPPLVCSWWQLIFCADLSSHHDMVLVSWFTQTLVETTLHQVVEWIGLSKGRLVWKICPSYSSHWTPVVCRTENSACKKYWINLFINVWCIVNRKCIQYVVILLLLAQQYLLPFPFFYQQHLFALLLNWMQTRAVLAKIGNSIETKFL